ncbi:MAG: hypothetical protein LBT12_02725 [Oscillospiraceae bacterium]|nr:hypothetical protein [Oscillospiraceae bacterium]
MEKTESIFNKDKFNSIWQRVRPEPPVLPGAGEAAAVLPGVGGTAALAPGTGVPEGSIAVTRVPTAPAAVKAEAAPITAAPLLGAAVPGKKAANAGDSAVLDELDRLRDFMDREAEAARYYCQIAARCGGRVRQVCERLAADCRRAIRRLNTRYFILTGEVYEPSSSVAPVASVQEALRRACADEITLASDYLDAAEETTVPGLAEIYGECACAARRRAACATRLLEQMM